MTKLGDQIRVYRENTKKRSHFHRYENVKEDSINYRWNQRKGT